MSTTAFNARLADSGFHYRLTDTRGYIRLVRKEPSGSRMDYKDYSHIYSDPVFRSRFKADPAFTARCLEVDFSIYQTLRSEVRIMQRLPEDAMIEVQWDWFECAWAVVIGVETMGWELDLACGHEVIELCTLARKMLELEIGTNSGRRVIQSIVSYVDGNVESLQEGRAS